MLGSISSHSLFANELEYDFINDAIALLPALRHLKVCYDGAHKTKLVLSTALTSLEIWAGRGIPEIVNAPSCLTLLDLHNRVSTAAATALITASARTLQSLSLSIHAKDGALSLASVHMPALTSLRIAAPKLLHKL